MRFASPSRFIRPPAALAAHSLIGCAVLCVLAAGRADAQDAKAQIMPSAASPLKASPRLAEQLPKGSGSEVPTYVFGQSVSGSDQETVIEGQAELRHGGTVLRADRLVYRQPTQQVRTTGQVRINNAGSVFTGPELQLQLDTFEGFFTEPVFTFLGGGNGRASRIDFIDNKRMVAHQASYTTCERANEASWQPAWVLRGERFYFDFEQEVGQATKPSLQFKDVTILAWPGTVSFPLSDKRKSGVLPPTFAVDTLGGVSVTAPYYLDIAPNRDATFTPTYMTKRGVDLAGEFRYLEPSYRGTVRGDYLPADQLRQRDRWSYSLQHTGNYRLAPAQQLGYNINFNRVSDDDYWRDFPRVNRTLTQRLLPSDVNLAWSSGDLSTAFRTVKWQTLQDLSSPTAPVLVPPYDRLPQLTARYARNNTRVGAFGGLDWSLDGDFTSFHAQRSLTGQANADRFVSRFQVSRPWVGAAGYITPKLQLHGTAYQFDESVAGRTSATRFVPTFSLDSGLQFERSASFFGNAFTQTLEPRAFYVRTPYRAQGWLPNYDSAENSFNFATIYNENAFVGNDRIADANLLTLGVTSRLMDPDTGAETARFGVAQRVRFDDQKVALKGESTTVSERLSDLLLGATIKWNPQWALDATTQYNPKLGESERTTLSARYNPSSYRVISAGYRRQRELSQQLDMGWQWPINDLWGDRGQDLGPGRGQGGGRWYSVGRLNYSLQDRKMVDTVMGLEYDGCCWIGRVVLRRSQTGAATANTQIMFQLELVGFSRIGNNPLAILRSNVPRYQNLRDQVSAPSRFSNYD